MNFNNLSKECLINNLIRKTCTEMKNGVIIERLLTPEEMDIQYTKLNSLTYEELDSEYEKIKSIESKSATLHSKGLVYLMLDSEYTILFIGSSSDLSKKRVLQSGRIKDLSITRKITSNSIGFEYGKRIKYVVTFSIKGYRQVESHLINCIKPEFNTVGVNNYLSDWEYITKNGLNMLLYDLDYLNSIYIGKKFNKACKIKYDIEPISKYMKGNTPKYKITYKYSLDLKLIDKYSSIKDAAIDNNLDKSDLSKARSGKNRTTNPHKCGNFLWYDRELTQEEIELYENI